MENCSHLSLNGTWVSLEMIPVWGMKVSSPACSPLRSWTSNSWCHTCQNATWSIANPISWIHDLQHHDRIPNLERKFGKRWPRAINFIKIFQWEHQNALFSMPSLSSMESAHYIIVHVLFDSGGNPAFGNHMLYSKSSHIHLFMLISSHFLITFMQVKIQIY